MKPLPVPLDLEAWYAVHKEDICSAVWGFLSSRSRWRMSANGYEAISIDSSEAGISATLTGELSFRLIFF